MSDGHTIGACRVVASNASECLKIADSLYYALLIAVQEVEDLRRYANNHGAMIDDEECDYGHAALAKARGEA